MKRVAPTDKDVIVAGQHRLLADEPNDLTQPPANAVTFDRTALLSRHREADSRWIVAVATLKHLQQEERSLASLAFLNGKKIRTALQPSGFRYGPRLHHLPDVGSGCGGRQADRRLRPRARRAARTLRPPEVAMRARKPWRRLRTSLDG